MGSVEAPSLYGVDNIRCEQLLCSHFPDVGSFALLQIFCLQVFQLSSSILWFTEAVAIHGPSV